MTTYTVQSGDSLSAIAARFNTTVQALAQANHITDANMIFVGQVLMIPNGATGSNGSSGSGTSPALAATFVVGPGLVNAMSEDGTGAASDEVYVNGNRAEAQWSEAMGQNGTLYRWVRVTNRIHRFPADA